VAAHIAPPPPGSPSVGRPLMVAERASMLTGQLRRPARHRPGSQHLPPAIPVFRQLPLHRAPGHPQRVGDILRMRTALDRPPAAA
jgi:hypothetical protein